MSKYRMPLPIASCAVLGTMLLAGAAVADPPPVQRAQVQARAEHMFQLADTNHDGWLSRAEYHAAILAAARRYDPKIQDKPLPAADAQFDAVDTAHQGRIAHDAFVAAALAHFDGADLNHDGTVTADEARKAAQIKQKKVQAQSPTPAR